MNQEQLEAYELYCRKRSVVITGSAGTGKSYVIGHVVSHLQQRFVHLTNAGARARASAIRTGGSRTSQQPATPWAITALTGVSSQTIGGQTLHSWAGIGLGDASVESLLGKIRKRPVALARWRTCQVLVIDEISMMDAELFEKLHEIGCRLRGRRERLFGGIQLVLAGDFLQLPPVKSDRFCFESPIWKKYLGSSVVYLKEIFRQSEPEFQQMLQRIRLGLLTTDDREKLNSRRLIGNKMPKGLVKPTVLFPYRSDVDEINRKKLERLIQKGAETVIYYPRYTVNEHSNSDFSSNSGVKMSAYQQQLERQANTYSGKKIWNKAGPFPYNLALKLVVKAQVMLTYNLDVTGGLVNGSRGVIVGFEPLTRDPIVLFDHGQQHTITRQRYTSAYRDFFVITRQYPLILAWAQSVHKSQSATLTSVVADLSEVFSPGQTYVCLSRVRNLSGLHLIGIDFRKIKCHKRARRFYCKECTMRLTTKCQENPWYERHLGGGEDFCWPCLLTMLEQKGVDLSGIDPWVWEKIWGYLA